MMLHQGGGAGGPGPLVPATTMHHHLQTSAGGGLPGPGPQTATTRTPAGPRVLSVNPPLARSRGGGGVELKHETHFQATILAPDRGRGSSTGRPQAVSSIPPSGTATSKDVGSGGVLTGLSNRLSPLASGGSAMGGRGAAVVTSTTANVIDVACDEVVEVQAQAEGEDHDCDCSSGKQSENLHPTPEIVAAQQNADHEGSNEAQGAAIEQRVNDPSANSTTRNDRRRRTSSSYQSENSGATGSEDVHHAAETHLLTEKLQPLVNFLHANPNSFTLTSLDSGTLVEINEQVYEVGELLGQGAYGAVFAAASSCSKTTKNSASSAASTSSPSPELRRLQQQTHSQLFPYAVKEIKAGNGLGLPDMTVKKLFYELHCLASVPKHLAGKSAPGLVGATCWRLTPDSAIIRFVMTRVNGQPLVEFLQEDKCAARDSSAVSACSTASPAPRPSSNRNKESNSNRMPDVSSAVFFVATLLYQIAEVQEILGEECIHRDVNTRNILVSGVAGSCAGSGTAALTLSNLSCGPGLMKNLEAAQKSPLSSCSNTAFSSSSHTTRRNSPELLLQMSGAPSRRAGAFPAASEIDLTNLPDADVDPSYTSSPDGLFSEASQLYQTPQLRSDQDEKEESNLTPTSAVAATRRRRRNSGYASCSSAKTRTSREEPGSSVRTVKQPRSSRKLGGYTHDEELDPTDTADQLHAREDQQRVEEDKLLQQNYLQFSIVDYGSATSARKFAADSGWAKLPPTGEAKQWCPFAWKLLYEWNDLQKKGVESWLRQNINNVMAAHHAPASHGRVGTVPRTSMVNDFSSAAGGCGKPNDLESSRRGLNIYRKQLDIYALAVVAMEVFDRIVPVRVLSDEVAAPSSQYNYPKVAAAHSGTRTTKGGSTNIGPSPQLTTSTSKSSFFPSGAGKGKARTAGGGGNRNANAYSCASPLNPYPGSLLQGGTTAFHQGRNATTHAPPPSTNMISASTANAGHLLQQLQRTNSLNTTQATTTASNNRGKEQRTGPLVWDLQLTTDHLHQNSTIVPDSDAPGLEVAAGEAAAPEDQRSMKIFPDDHKYKNALSSNNRLSTSSCATQNTVSTSVPSSSKNRRASTSTAATASNVSLLSGLTAPTAAESSHSSFAASASKNQYGNRRSGEFVVEPHADKNYQQQKAFHNLQKSWSTYEQIAKQGTDKLFAYSKACVEEPGKVFRQSQLWQELMQFRMPERLEKGLHALERDLGGVIAVFKKETSRLESSASCSSSSSSSAKGSSSSHARQTQEIRTGNNKPNAVVPGQRQPALYQKTNVVQPLGQFLQQNRVGTTAGCGPSPSSLLFQQNSASHSTAGEQQEGDRQQAGTDPNETESSSREQIVPGGASVSARITEELQNIADFFALIRSMMVSANTTWSDVKVKAAEIILLVEQCEAQETTSIFAAAGEDEEQEQESQSIKNSGDEGVDFVEGEAREYDCKAQSHPPSASASRDQGNQTPTRTPSSAANEAVLASAATAPQEGTTCVFAAKKELHFTPDTTIQEPQKQNLQVEILDPTALQEGSTTANEESDAGNATTIPTRLPAVMKQVVGEARGSTTSTPPSTAVCYTLDEMAAAARGKTPADGASGILTAEVHEQRQHSSSQQSSHEPHQAVERSFSGSSSAHDQILNTSHGSSLSSSLSLSASSNPARRAVTRQKDETEYEELERLRRNARRRTNLTVEKGVGQVSVEGDGATPSATGMADAGRQVVERQPTPKLLSGVTDESAVGRKATGGGANCSSTGTAGVAGAGSKHVRVNKTAEAGCTSSGASVVVQRQSGIAAGDGTTRGGGAAAATVRSNNSKTRGEQLHGVVGGNKTTGSVVAKPREVATNPGKVWRMK
ncbi:unnamed protein product [Amoebophrya sp. A120]|nr:unnamed protein product [Amoebophrya sp. A120]|eukprot:GSA120T00008506001.1